jgi:hypothetical protein
MTPPDIALDERRTYCLVFADPDEPSICKGCGEGARQLGAAIVDVLGSEAMAEWVRYPEMYDQVKGPWMAAAVRESWAQGCNPGGQIMLLQLVDPMPPGQNWLRLLEHNRLYTDEEMHALARVPKH